MARIRSIKPEFFTSETMAKCSHRARLLFIGLWTQCDDEGRMVDNARILVGQLFPLDDEVDAKALEADLRELAALKLIVRYEAEGRNYLAVRSFDEHQRVNRPTPSKLPAPPSDGGFSDPSGSDREDSRRTHGEFSEGSSPKGKEGKGKEDAREPLAAVLPLLPASEHEASQPPDEFDVFYEAYPRKKDRQGALKAWKRLRVSERQTALQAVVVYAKAMSKTDPQFIPYPAKWLSNRRWEDEVPQAAVNNGRVYDPDTGAWLSASAVGRMS